jgi:hypothetical protein
METNTIELEDSEGGIARWNNIPDDKFDEIAAAIEKIIGKPDTML